MSRIRNLGSVVAEGGVPGAAALMLAAVATFFLVAILFSPNGWKWWGAASVSGHEQGGVASYEYHHQYYSFDDVGSERSGPLTVYVNPSQPGDATLSLTVAQASDSALTGGLYLAAVAFGVVAWRRRARRPAPGKPPGFGEGIDSETVRRILAQRGSRPTG